MSSAKHTELNDSLTPREEEVLSAIVRDRTVEQIAKDMGYHSHSSVYTILDRIRAKLGAKTIHGAAAIHAHHLGLTGELLHPGATRDQPRFFRCGEL